MKFDLVAELMGGDSPDMWIFEGERHVMGYSIGNVELPVPEVVQSALNAARQQLGARAAKSPLAYFDSSGHGDNLGLVFYESIGKRPRGDINSTLPMYQVSARVSYGPNNGGKILDASKIDRLHIGVFAARHIRPEHVPGTAIAEELHFSLRWVNGRFDDWNVESRVEKNDHNSVRSSWVKTTAIDHERYNISKLPVAQSLFEDSQERYIIGFEPVLDVLNKTVGSPILPTHDSQNMHTLSIDAGIRYTMGIVLSAAMMFALPK